MKIYVSNCYNRQFNTWCLTYLEAYNLETQFSVPKAQRTCGFYGYRVTTHNGTNCIGGGSLHEDVCVIALREVFVVFSCVLDQEELEQQETGCP